MSTATRFIQSDDGSPWSVIDIGGVIIADWLDHATAQDFAALRKRTAVLANEQRSARRLFGASFAESSIQNENLSTSRTKTPIPEARTQLWQ